MTISIYMYTHTHTYIHIHIYICIHIYTYIHYGILLVYAKSGHGRSHREVSWGRGTKSLCGALRHRLELLLCLLLCCFLLLWLLMVCEKKHSSDKENILGYRFSEHQIRGSFVQGNVYVTVGRAPQD